MSESKNSGEFILNNLQIFNEAFCFFEKSIRPIIEKGIDRCVEKFSKQNDWNGKFQFEINKDNWLQPKHWNTEEGIDASFHIDSTESKGGDDNFWLALFCNKTNDNCQAGFFFNVEPRHFGGKHAWNAHIRSIPEEQKARLKEIGFKQFENSFYLPIALSNEELAKNWRRATEPFAHDDECFEPLRATLEKLKQSVPVFDAIMESARASQTA